MKILIAILESSYTMFVTTKLPKRWTYFCEIATYIKNQGYDVKILDCLDPKISHGEILQAIAKDNYKLIVLLARPETTRSIFRISPLIKQISPSSKILIYGDTAHYCPNLFKKDFADAVIVNGDWECGFDDYLNYLEGKKSLNELEGVSCNVRNAWTNAKSGRLKSSEEWALPDLKTKNFINKELYFSINNRQLTITVSRGCPFNCTFCPAVITFGHNDRRMPCEKIITYIKDNKNEFKSLKFFSPTFTHDVEWVKKLSKLMIKNNCVVPWVCTSRPDYLNNDEMIKLMADAGCVKVAIGVETLDKESNAALRKFGNIDDYIELVRQVFENLKKYHIEPKPLMMLGLPGQNRSNLKESFDLLKAFGAKEIRAASYSPRQLLHVQDKKKTVKIDDIERIDKMTYQNVELPDINREEYLKLIYDTDNYAEILK